MSSPTKLREMAKELGWPPELEKAADQLQKLKRENAELNRKLDQILTNKDYEGGVQFWIKKHDAVLLREASLLAENAALREQVEHLIGMIEQLESDLAHFSTIEAFEGNKEAQP